MTRKKIDKFRRNLIIGTVGVGLGLVATLATLTSPNFYPTVQHKKEAPQVLGVLVEQDNDVYLLKDGDVAELMNPDTRESEYAMFTKTDTQGNTNIVYFSNNNDINGDGISDGRVQGELDAILQSYKLDNGSVVFIPADDSISVLTSVYIDRIVEPDGSWWMGKTHTSNILWDNTREYSWNRGEIPGTKRETTPEERAQDKAAQEELDKAFGGLVNKYAPQEDK